MDRKNGRNASSYFSAPVPQNGALILEDTHWPKNSTDNPVNFAGAYLFRSIGLMPVTYLSQMARGRGLPT